MEKIEKAYTVLSEMNFSFRITLFHLCVMRNEGEDSFYSYISYEKISVGKWRISLWDRPVVISSILVISIVIDSDTEHCYEHLKKINLR